MQLFYPLFAGQVIVFLASLFGNSVIIHVVRTVSTMKTTTNYSILPEQKDEFIPVREL